MHYCTFKSSRKLLKFKIPDNSALTSIYEQIIKAIMTIHKNLKHPDDAHIYESVKITLENNAVKFLEKKGSI